MVFVTLTTANSTTSCMHQGSGFKLLPLLFKTSMDKRREYYFDDNLRDIPKDPEGLKALTIELEESLKEITDPRAKVRILGPLGVHLRTLQLLDQAQEKLLEALRLIQNHNLGTQWEVIQKIRLGHVLQWKKDFNASDVLFNEVLKTCRENKEAGEYLDFALQHAAKNLFDQAKYQEALALFKEALVLRKNKNSPADQLESTLHAIQITKTRLI